MRDYSRFDTYLDRLCQDIYPQPEDAGHTAWAEDAINWGLDRPHNIKSILDVGCGTGFCSDIFTDMGFMYSGITASNEDYQEAKRLERNVTLGDMTYLTWPDESFDLIFARHILEHSPFPIITLMEWWRVSKKYLFLVAPIPDFWQYIGKNHYSMAELTQLTWWLNRAGWQLVAIDTFTTASELYQKYNPPCWGPMEIKDVEYRSVWTKVEPKKE